MIKKSLFIITSGIHTPYGKCSTQERIEHTWETLKSIKTYAPDSSVVMLDCGESSVDKNLFDCDIIDYTVHSEIKSYLKDYRQNTTDDRPEVILKSMSEILICEDYFKQIDKNQYNRIFKLCGRYRLNSKFEYSKHLNSKNKVLILPPYFSHHLYNLNVNVNLSPLQYMTRFFSFDSTLLPEISETYQKMKNEIIKMSQTKKEGDIEHLLFKHLKKKIVDTTRVIGIEGYWAPLKLWIEE